MIPVFLVYKDGISFFIIVSAIVNSIENIFFASNVMADSPAIVTLFCFSPSGS